MRGSYKIRCFITVEEALVTVPYLDGEDRLGNPLYSNGVGHGGVSPATPKLTIPEAFAQLGRDLAVSEDWLNKTLRVTLSQQEYDGVLSPLFARGATRMGWVIELLNQGKKDEAMAALRSVCITSKGKYSKSLARRRDREIDVFFDGNYGKLDTFLLFEGPPRGENKVDPVPTPFPPETASHE